VDEIRQRVIVTGMVQGVGFRMNTRAEALRLGLSGTARNLADGTVEVIAQGPGADVDALVRWLHHGPRYAEVASVDVEAVAVERSPQPGFRVG
jgi:acylphosphatase